MKYLVIAVSIFTLFLATPVFAGSGHSHGPAKAQEKVSSIEVTKKASSIVESLAKQGTIPTSWVGLKENKVEQKKFNQQLEWVVSYKNKEIQDASKQTLYLFFTLYGEYLAANYSGN